MLPAYLNDIKTGKRLHTTDGNIITSNEPQLVNTTVPLEHGVYKSTTRTTAGTTVISTPIPGGSIQVTGFVLSTAKGAGQTTTLQFNDGSNTEPFVIVDMDLALVSTAMFTGTRVRGWMDAWVEIITSGAADATVVLYYYKIPEGQAFAAWDAER